MATGTLFIISAPSGAGKSSLIQAYLKRRTTAHAAVSISHTTRPPRVGESHGVHYYFIKPQEFEQMIEKGDFLEHAKVFDNYYGTSKSAIETHLNHGSDVFLDIDWQGARQVRSKMPNAKSIFILPPSLAELKNRLENRGQDSQEVIDKRMQKAKDEMSHYNEYDYLIVNDHFDTSVEQLNAIMLAERLNTSKQIESHQSLIEDLLR